MPPQRYYYTKKMAPVIPQETQADTSEAETRPLPNPAHPKPLLRLTCTNLRDEQALRILKNLDPHLLLDYAVNKVLSLLYPGAEVDAVKAAPPWPGTRSITFVIDSSYGGVAETHGIAIDDDHKEIHFATGYAGRQPDSGLRHEVTGVMVHEMVHCWQWNASGTAPVGLIEGIADWVRLHANLAPPHWHRKLDRDAGPWTGYQSTAYFLDWIELGRAKGGIGGKGTVPKVNAALRCEKYNEEEFWLRVVGRQLNGTDGLWYEYCDWLESILTLQAGVGADKAMRDGGDENKSSKVVEGS